MGWPIILDKQFHVDLLTFIGFAIKHALLFIPDVFQIYPGFTNKHVFLFYLPIYYPHLTALQLNDLKQCEMVESDNKNSE